MNAVAAEQAGVLHVPPAHVDPAPHTTPQSPQLAGSVSTFTQVLPHTRVPAGVVRGPQVPVESPVFASVHPWHDRLHAAEQQTPSLEQKPDAHSPAAAQAAPVAFLTAHAVPAQ